MELNTNEAAVRADTADAQGVTTSAGEIDLYDELIAFAELSPEEQLRLLDRAVRMEAQREITSAAQGQASVFSEAVLTHAPIEPVKSEPAGAETVTPPTGEVEEHIPPEQPFTYGGRAASFRESRPSGPLSGFSLTPDFVFTGALTRGVCLDCGAETGADDVFCMTCGAFIDEIAATLPFNPTCAECKQGIKAGEVFCPWCGCSLPG